VECNSASAILRTLIAVRLDAELTLASAELGAGRAEQALARTGFDEVGLC
jgi:hypothetical protein